MRAVKGTVSVAATVAGVLAYNDQGIWGIISPFANMLLDPEEIHRFAVTGASQPRYLRQIAGMIYAEPKHADTLKTKVWDIQFDSAVGLAAGFDKHAECIEGMLDLGFGFVEVGSITKLPQSGNDKPRVWKVPYGVINRYGFNSEGFDKALDRLETFRQGEKQGIVGVNIGKNKVASEEQAILDYSEGVKRFYDVADYLVINVSSPNTPGLRGMQQRETLKTLLTSVMNARNESYEQTGRKVPLLVKISPDENDDAVEDIAAVVREVNVDGIIVSNTTVNFPNDLKHRGMHGGLSGSYLMEPSTELLGKMYKLTEGQIPLIGVGGISTGKDAYRKIKAGASLVQLYTSMALEGPNVPFKVKKDLCKLLRKDGFKNINEAIGADHRQQSD